MVTDICFIIQYYYYNMKLKNDAQKLGLRVTTKSGAHTNTLRN